MRIAIINNGKVWNIYVVNAISDVAVPQGMSAVDHSLATLTT